MTSDVRLRIALPVIILAQLFGTSLWFSINGVWLSLSSEQGFTEADLGAFTLAVQLGFIIGTLSLALTGLADRYKASMIFCISSVFGALVNTLFILAVDHFMLAWLLRLLTGLCLAGIYPMGMKLVISWVPKYAGSALSWLLAMLTLGTALPHLMRGFTLGLGWQAPLFTASVLAVLGGITVGALGCGPHLPATAKRAALSQGLSALKIPNFRSIAGGYFGHCWELYAFWMLVPLLVVKPVTELNWSLSSILPICPDRYRCSWLPGRRLVESSNWRFRCGPARVNKFGIAVPNIPFAHGFAPIRTSRRINVVGYNGYCRLTSIFGVGSTSGTSG